MNDECATWIKAHMEDCTNSETIIFALKCVLCDTKNKTMPATVDALIEARETVYAAEYVQAIADFSDILTQCPVCRRFVCEQCVRFNEDGHLCAACAKEEANTP